MWFEGDLKRCDLRVIIKDDKRCILRMMLKDVILGWS